MSPPPEHRRRVMAWFWPPPAIARRLWLTILGSTAYTAVVYWGFPGSGAWAAGWATAFGIINGVILGALVGFRTKAAYDRWWEGRILWGQLTNDSRNLCLKATALADPPEEDRRELARLVAGFAAALMRHLRPAGAHPIPGFAHDPDAPRHVPAHLAGQVFALLARWRKSDRIDGHAQQLLDTHAAALMNVCGGCERIRNTPLPGSYLSLVRHGLILSFLLLPWHLTNTLGVWALGLQAVLVYFMFGVELVAEEVEQPFAFDPDDLPLEQFCETIRANAAEILAVES
jgi:putative membrane protein